MKDLKEILFENMYRAFKCAKNKESRTEDHEFYMYEVYVLWHVILEAGLYEEYGKYVTLKKHKNIGEVVKPWEDARSTHTVNIQ